MPTAKYLVEDEVPDYPSYIHQDKLNHLEWGDHPLGDHPAVPEKTANDLFSAGYKHLMQTIERYTGLSMRNPRHVQRLPQLMFQVLDKVIKTEKRHRQKLEDLAVKVVLQMPQFKGLDQALERKDLQIEPELSNEIDLGGVQQRADQGAEDQVGGVPEEESEEIAYEIEQLVKRRKLVNHLIQGGATNCSYAFHLAEEELSRIDPHLLQEYGVLMALAEFGHWATADEQVAAALQQEMTKGGKSEVKMAPVKEAPPEEEGGGEEAPPGGERQAQVPTVYARAQSFPMLIHELVKGLLEYLSYSDEDDPETIKRVNSIADVIEDEPWHLILGPEMWRRTLAALEDQEQFPEVYDKLMKMPTGEFNDLMKSLLAKAPDAKARIKKLLG